VGKQTKKARVWIKGVLPEDEWGAKCEFCNEPLYYFGMHYKTEDEKERTYYHLDCFPSTASADEPRIVREEYLPSLSVTKLFSFCRAAKQLYEWVRAFNILLEELEIVQLDAALPEAIRIGRARCDNLADLTIEYRNKESTPSGNQQYFTQGKTKQKSFAHTTWPCLDKGCKMLMCWNNICSTKGHEHPLEHYACTGHLATLGLKEELNGQALRDS
jgi:hypothetical protein